MDDFASSRTAERPWWAGVGLVIGWALFAPRNPRVQFSSGLHFSPGQNLPRTGPGLCPTSLQLLPMVGTAGLPPPGEAGVPCLFKEWFRLPGLDSSAFYRHPQGSAKNGRKCSSPASAQPWTLLFSTGGSRPEAGLPGGPSPARRRLSGGSATSLQCDVMFPGLGRKGLQLPACVGIQDIACWGLGAGGCTPSSMSPAPLQDLRSLEL